MTHMESVPASLLVTCPRCEGEGKVLSLNHERCAMCGRYFDVEAMVPWNPSEWFAMLCKRCDSKDPEEEE